MLVHLTYDSLSCLLFCIQSITIVELNVPLLCKLSDSYVDRHMCQSSINSNMLGRSNSNGGPKMPDC